MARTLDRPLLPTGTVGSHAYPAWFRSALDEIRAGNYGTTGGPRTCGKPTTMRSTWQWTQPGPDLPGLSASEIGTLAIVDQTDARRDQLLFGFANRQLDEIDLWREFDVPHELRKVRPRGAGAVDVKSFWIEAADEVAARSRTQLLAQVRPRKTG